MKKIFPVLIFIFLFASCEEMILGPDPGNSALDNFDFIWKDFDRYYALFDVKKVDWNEIKEKYRSRLNENSTQDELWQAVTEMLGELNDPHTFIMEPDLSRKFISGYLNGRNPDEFSWRVAADNYLTDDYKVAGENHMLYGTIRGKNIGYIYVATFAGNNNTWSHDIDVIVEQLYNTDAIILDIRNNTGGSGENYSYIASTFIDKQITFMKWKQRSGVNHSDFTPFVNLTVEPRYGKKQYLKNIILLTNRFSGSSSDHFTWLFKEYLPNAVTVGDTTVGCFGSTTAYKSMPNGWLYNFSGRLAESMDGVTLDSLGGTVPDYLIENTKEEIENKQDKQLEFAINYLSGK